MTKKAKIMQDFEKQIQTLEHLNYLEAKELLKCAYKEKDEERKAKIIKRVFEGTLHYVLKFIKENHYEELTGFGYDLNDVINSAYEIWYLRIINYELLKYDISSRILNITFCNELIEKLIPSEEEREHTYIIKREYFELLFILYINMRNERMDINSYDIFDKYFYEVNINNYDIDIEYVKYQLIQLFNIGYDILSRHDSKVVNIGNENLRRVSRLLATIGKIECIKIDTYESIDMETKALDKYDTGKYLRYIFEESMLTQKEKEILILYYGLFGNKSYSIQDIAKLKKVSSARIRQINAMAFRKVEKKLRIMMEEK